MQWIAKWESDLEYNEMDSSKKKKKKKEVKVAIQQLTPAYCFLAVIKHDCNNWFIVMNIWHLQIQLGWLLAKNFRKKRDGFQFRGVYIGIGQTEEKNTDPTKIAHSIQVYKFGIGKCIGFRHNLYLYRCVISQK